MAEKLVALEVIEYPTRDGKAIKRLTAGDTIPELFPQADLAELRKHGAIGTQADFDKKTADAEADAAKARAAAVATAAGLMVVDADGGSGADSHR